MRSERVFDLVERSVCGHLTLCTLSPGGTVSVFPLLVSLRDEETIELLDDWLKRPDDDQFVDLRQPPWNFPASWIVAASLFLSPNASAPTSCDSASPFLLFGGAAGTIKGSGIDFILPYWMARYYEVL